MEIKTKPKDRRGGPRPGSGRKPNPAKALNREIADRLDEAEYAFNLFVKLMRDEDQSNTTRLECATEVMNRVLGKPRQQIDQKQTGGLTVRVEFVRRDPDPARAAPVASGDPGIDPSLQRRRLWETLREVGAGDPSPN
jgi:hypothetical protein